ncbi:MAG: type II secretion system F family protein [Candidatus Paceibacterota bacterium]|jgi:type II secretory pathway component PulF
MIFYFVAAQLNGKVIEGEVEASGTADVLEYLSKQGLRPISLKASKEKSLSKKRFFGGETITLEDKIFLTKYLGIMLKVGTDILKAVDVLIADFESPGLRSLLVEIRSALEKGQPFYTVFARYPKYFSSVFINLIKAGEASGNLEKVFEDLSKSLEQEAELKREIRSALTYPAILLVASVGILLLLCIFALPKIAKVFEGGDIKPPLFSRIVFAVGLFLGKYVIFVLLFLFGIVFFCWYFFFKTETGRAFIQRMTTKIPVVKTIVKNVGLQSFCTTLASLLKSGLPIIDSLEITAQAVGYEEIKISLLRISREGISKGLTISEAFRQEPVFPRMVVNLIAVSEKAGHVEDILLTLAGFYEADIKSSIKILVSFLEPVLLVLIGGIIGLIAASVIVPIYQMTTAF